MKAWLSYAFLIGDAELQLDGILQSISCRYEGKAIKRLHGSNCAELFGIWEAE
jgi:hypothetical protein